jgi:hypothetical protein
MAAFLVHQGAVVQCSHAGQASPMVPDPRVRVSGQSIVTLSVTYTVAGCPFTTGGSPQPCLTGQWLSGATRVYASGQPVILQNSQSTSTPNGTPLNVLSTQVRVRGT